MGGVFTNAAILSSLYCTIKVMAGYMLLSGAQAFRQTKNKIKNMKYFFTGTGLTGTSKSEQTHGQTDGRTEGRTNRLIESISPEGRCFDHIFLYGGPRLK